jgi:branched-chain amino acid aminotransferase
METCLLSYYLHNKEFKSSCDFNLKINSGSVGVYEVIRVIDGKPLYIENHIDRFFESCKISNINASISFGQIKKRVKTLIELNSLSTGNIKWALVKENGLQDFYIWPSPFFYPSNELIANGVSCEFYKATRYNPNSKNFKETVQNKIRNYITENELFEVILVDENNKVSEGSRTNLFFSKENKIFTSKDTDVLQGISRDKVLEICKNLNIITIKRDIYSDEINTFDFAFLSGTSINVLPIKNVGEKVFSTDNKLFSSIFSAYKIKLKRYIDEFDWNL